MVFSIQQTNNTIKNKLKKVYSNAEIQQLRFMIYEKLCGLSKIHVITNPQELISHDKYDKLINAADRLAVNEPIQYVLGETEFFDLPFKVNPDVLIPRPETEELVHWILNTNNNSKLKILDIGTGSGCIAIALAKNIKDAEVYAMDVSPKAIEVATINSTLNRTSIKFIEDNILDVNPKSLPNELDILVSNPPYVKETEKSLMNNNVLSFEPHLALFVTNENPLIFYEKIAKIGALILKKKGMLFFEINEALAEDVKYLLEQLDYSQIEIRKDFFGKDRMIKANR